MKVRITLTNGFVIEIEQNKKLDRKEYVKEQILKILNNDGKFINFSGEIFDENLYINKALIENIVTYEVEDENN